jgi:geranylgeranyl diphosphate synthase type I
MASPLDVADLRQRVEKALTTFLAGQAGTLHAVGEELAPVHEAATAFLLDAGKRLRPAFAYWGWRGAGGDDSADGEQIVPAVSCLELLHACALVHDDVMDASDTRRGHPSVHRKFAALHRSSGWSGDPDAFGRAAAILLGDLYLVWADAMLSGSGLHAEVLLRAQPVYDEMRVELMAGEYLDVLAKAVGGTARGAADVDRALRVARYKSGKYTIERPLHLGAALAGAGPEVTRAYSAYGLPLGEAFQLRDDILGVFGDPEVTGKPAGDDLREGKRTALIAHAGAAATPAQAAVLSQHFGDPHLDPAGVTALRTVIVETGALGAVERLIDEKTAQAVAGLRGAPLTAEAVDVLSELATVATTRLG